MIYDEDYFKSEDFRELLDSYETAVQTGSYPFMDADDLVDIADYYNMSGEHDKAVEAVAHALEIYPAATLPNVFMAREALTYGDFEEAKRYADAIEKTDDPDYHYLRAELLIAEGDIKQADRYLRNYGRTVPNDELEDFIRDCANLYIDYGVSDKAYEWMMRSKGDDSVDFKELMARTLFGLGKYKDSERLFNELIDRDPYSTRYWNALASAQFMNEEYNESITSSEYALAIDPNDEDGLVSKANGLIRLGNYEEALKYFHRYTEMEPDDTLGHFHEAACLFNLGRHQEAVEVMEKALATAPEDDTHYLAQVYQELAFGYSALKQLPKALEMLDKTETLDCDHADIMVIRGHLQLENEHIEEAEESFKKAISMSDSSPDILLRIITSLYDNHYVYACYEMFRKFFSIIDRLNPDFSNGYAYMALCCYELGHAKEFMQYLRQACEKNPDEARQVLAFLFPEGTEVKDYYQYMLEKLKEQKETES